MEQQYLISIADDPIIIKIQPVISALGWVLHQAVWSAERNP